MHESESAVGYRIYR